MALLGVAALDKGRAIAGTPRVLPARGAPEGSALGVRLDLSHACSPECFNIYGLVSKYPVNQIVGYIKGKSAIAIARKFRDKRRNFNGKHF